jgi:hypothetical protein
MDRTESQALEFLRSRGLNDAIYEPDGNMPPDFACRGIAVEARRLNQHDESGKGLEVSELPLAMKFRNLLSSLGPPRGTSWFVTFRYRRPLEHWATLRPKIKTALLNFPGNTTQNIDQLSISDSFSIGLARSSKIFEARFVLGGFTDHNSGGWIISEMIRNLNIVIPEKSKKIASFRPRYSEWWLVLVDHIGHARLDSHEIAGLREHITRPPEWDKIFLVDPLAPEHAIEI